MEKQISQVYRAEGDPWTYVTYEDGSIVAIGQDGRPRRAPPGSEPHSAIVAQIESGQLQPTIPDGADEAASPEDVGLAPSATPARNLKSGSGGDAVIDTGAPIGGKMDLGAADRATAGATADAMRKKGEGYGEKRNSILDRIMSGVSSAASLPGEAMGSVRDGIGKGVDAAKEYMAGDEEPEKEDPLADLRAQESVDIKAGQYRRAADRATSGWEDEVMKRKRASQGR